MPGPILIRCPENSREWEVIKQLLRDYRKEFDDDTCFTSFEEEMDHIEELYAQPDKLKLIAIDSRNQEIAGCVALRSFAPGIAEMKRLYVIPSRRGQKLGRLLAESILREAVTRGYRSMILDTMLQMKSARQLYEKLGFHVSPPYNHQDPERVICYEMNFPSG